MRTTPLVPLLALVALCATGRLTAQPYWVRHVGSLGNDHISDVKVDQAGDVYVTGEFSGDADFADSTYTALGGIDCFVAKLSAAGEVLWWKQGGGYGIDRGIKLAFGPNNTLAVVGEFMGQADFQGVTITSQMFTPDMFCAVLDRGTGTQQWIRHGGGSEGADRPYGVTVSPTGQVTMVGEFKGLASWDGFNLTSVMEQDTTVRSMDVVVVSYSASGTALWVQQGAADRTDRAIDAVSDPQGNIYVAGQFSDTITFDVEHINAMYNATFLLKLDAAGNEVWFRRCGGGIYDHVRDLLFTPDDQLLIVGDLQGTMIFLDDVPDFISGEQAYNYYLLRVSTDGQLVAQGQIGSENGLSARGIDLRDDTIAVVGQFNCQFTSLSSHYGGTGLFMAAGAEDIFVTKHRYGDLGFIEARHYGGPGAKLAGQVAILPDGDVLACGSYARSISFATTTANPIAGDLFEGYVATSQPTPPGSCPDLATAQFRSQDASGLKDGFLARAYVRDSVVYDWWSQADAVCDHPATWSMCVAANQGYTVCPDTLVSCGPVNIHAFTPFLPSIEDQNSVGPLVEVTWSNGDSTITSYITETGTYSVQVDAANGCWSWSDAIYVVVNPMPPVPQISDNVPQNINSVAPTGIQLCDPDSVLLWCPNVDTGTTYFWTSFTGSPPPDTSFTTSVFADTSGIWTFTMVTAAGCMQSTPVDVVDIATPDLDSLGLVAHIVFLSDSVATDSLALCPGEDLQFQVVVQWYWNGDSIPFPQDLILQVSLNGGDYATQTHPDGWTGGDDVWATGWCHIHLNLLVMNGACGGDSLIFQVDGDIWVDGWPQSTLDIALTGASTICVGDSALLMMSCVDCEAFEWSGANVNGDTTVSVWALLAGTYSVHGTATDEHGCSYDGGASLTIGSPSGPLLLIDPLDGIICPFDSALVYTNTPGTVQVWYGPYGPVPNNSQQLWTTIPGEYYLTMTDSWGCALVSDPALITAYSTPYLNVIPDNVLCLNEEEAIIQVMTTAPSSIIWSAPFSGSALQQTVTEPGTYSVSSTACDITTEMSVTVVASDVAAEVAETGPFDLCAGESVVLHAVPGQAVYIWQPGNVFADSLVVTGPGEYFLEVVDGNGCADTSTVVLVSVTSIAQPLMAAGDTICSGQTATLTAVGSGIMTWYSDASAQDPLFNGSPIMVDGLMTDTTFYVVQTEGPCASAVQAAVVDIEPVPEAGTIDAPTLVCGGGEAIITFVGTTGANVQWTTPGGASTGTQVIIPEFSADDSGVYTALPFIGNCYGEPVSVVVGFAVPVPFSLGPDTTYCIGGWYTLMIPGAYADPTWSTGAETYALQVNSDGYYTAYAIDSNGCAVQDEAYINGIECGPILPNVITPNGDGNNDVLVITGSEGFELAIRIFNRWGQLVWESSGRDIRWNGHHINGDALVDGVYYYELLRTGLGISQPYTGYVQVMRGK
jgi:gliding motility-associated-like protein